MCLEITMLAYSLLLQPEKALCSSRQVAHIAFSYQHRDWTVVLVVVASIAAVREGLRLGWVPKNLGTFSSA